MLQLFFRNSRDEYELVGCPANKDASFNLIMADIKRRNPKFKVYYVREYSPGDNGWLWFDVGSHTEFYVLKGDWQ